MRIILANVMADVNLTYSNVNTCTDQNTLAKVNMNIMVTILVCVRKPYSKPEGLKVLQPSEECWFLQLDLNVWPVHQ